VVISTSGDRTRRSNLGDLGRIVHYDPPANLSAHAFLTAGRTSIQIVAPTQHAYAPLDASPEPKRPLEPTLLLILLALLVSLPLCGRATRRMPALLAVSSPSRDAFPTLPHRSPFNCCVRDLLDLIEEVALHLV